MKIEEQVLSREQMAHLQELGVDTSDASIYWIRAERMEGFRKHNIIDNDLGKWRLSLSRKLIVPAAWKVEYIPTYTIGDLIEKLPKSDKSGSLLINPANNEIDYGDWVYYDGELCELENFAGFIGKSVIDSLYELICWIAGKHKELIK